MKILYLVDIDFNQMSGVASKVCMQAKQWEKEGHTVILLSTLSLSFFDLEGKRLSKPKILRNKGKLSFIINVYKGSILLKYLLKDIDFDIVYMRYRIYDFFFKSAVQKKTIVAEMNTVYEQETKNRSYLSYLYYILFKNLSFNTINGFVCISNEIKHITLKNNYKSLVLANGIDTSLFQVENRKRNVKPTLVFIGSPHQKWHGVDKIIFLSAKIKEFDFHIIGIAGNDTDNLFYHGYLSTEEFLPILKKSDIGIGSLAMHRLGINEASPLKSRQYLALGLPIIYAYHDTDIKDDLPFVLELENEENNIHKNIENIKNFVYNVFDNNNIQFETQQFAKSTFDIVEKEQKRLQFMNELLLNGDKK